MSDSQGVTPLQKCVEVLHFLQVQPDLEIVMVQRKLTISELNDDLPAFTYLMERLDDSDKNRLFLWRWLYNVDNIDVLAPTGWSI
jgi:hypothetical protein